MDYRLLAEQLLGLRTRLLQLPLHHGLSELEHGTYLALNYMLQCGGTAYPKDLARCMAVSSARVAALLNHMQQAGLACRAPDPSDNRQVLVTLTERGRRAIQQKRENAVALLAQVLEELGEADAQALVRIQQKMVSRLLDTGQTAR